ncbi:hypothetical protein SAMD00079811_44690 [Scytonema sp. HK-05]|uniref:hypothetical protein n=2 Tax=unclassified Scytonema TaxID=2618749 RepID=UPI000B21D78C|nr:hypothetical protein [Scytonema sp. HK-05]BAY46854.1 hypothetical protein SAMD00079811_44690 [Scytonema sp. HK-05]
MMLTVGDCAIHQKTGESGVVIGYGHELVNNAYQTTLKVLVSNQNETNQTSSIKEDLYSEWLKSDDDGQRVDN